MTKRYAVAMLAAVGMISGLATMVTPSAESAAPVVAGSQTMSTESAGNVVAIKNQAWPPAAMITVEPCAVAECRDA